MSFYSRYGGFGFQLPRAAGVDSVQVPPALSQPISVPPHVLSILLSAQPQPPPGGSGSKNDGSHINDPLSTETHGAALVTADDSAPPESLFQKVGPWLWVPIALAAAVTIVVVLKKKSGSGSMGRYKRRRSRR